MKNKKVIFLGSTPPPYMGPNLATLIILNSNLKNDFKLLHLDTSDHRDLSTLNKLDLWNLILPFKHYFMLGKLILKYWPGLIYIPVCQTTLGYLRDAGFIFIGKIFSRKIICHLRGGNFRNWYLSAGGLTRWFVRRVHSLVDGQIVLGENLRGLFQEFLPDEKIFVVPNGADYFFDVEKNEIFCDDKIKILFLSNLRKEKGLFDFLLAIPEIAKFNKNLEFIISGDWRDNETKIEFDKFVREYPNLPIIFTGPVSGKSKFDLLASSDIFVLPTYYPAEGHPWVIVEAMAAGLPIITTNQGAITESVKDGINGFIVEKRNPYQIAEKIRFLIEHPGIRKKMGEESRWLYLENFTEEKMTKRLSNAFHVVLSGHVGR